MTDELADELEQLANDSDTSEQSEVGSEDSDVLVVDGKEYRPRDIKELEAAGMRYSDYTKKTQDLARQRKELEKEQEGSKDLQQAEQQELEQWRRLDKLITSDPQRFEQFKAIIAGAKQEQPSQKVPEELLDEVKKLKLAEEARILEQEMSEVRELVGSITKKEQEDFYSFVDEMQKGVEGVIPLANAARMYPAFHEKIVEKTLAGRQKDKEQRESLKAKTKETGKGRKATNIKGPKMSDAEFLADIERALGG